MNFSFQTAAGSHARKTSRELGGTSPKLSAVPKRAKRIRESRERLRQTQTPLSLLAGKV